MRQVAPRNPRLYEAARAYAEAGLALLRERSGFAVIAGMWEWARVDDRFEQSPKRVVFADVVSHGAALHELAEFRTLVEEIRRDEIIAPKLDRMLGTALGGLHLKLDAEEIADRLLSASLSEESLGFDATVFDRAFLAFEDHYYSESVRFTLIAPFPGFESDVLPIRLDDDAEIDLLEDREILACLQGDVLRPMGGLMPVVFVSDLAGLRLKFELPRISADKLSGEQRMAAATPVFEKLSGDVERLLQALRLLKSGSVGLRGYVYFSDDWQEQNMTRFQNVSTALSLPFANYSITAAEAGQLATLWTGLGNEAVGRHNTLSIVLRRFLYAGDRDRPDDRLVDLMIAAEALFLPGERLELGYKLAMRSAFFLESEGFDRREVFAHMKRAYSVRGDIVHGETVDRARLPEGTQVTLEVFTERTADYLRAALQKAIRIAGGTEAGSLSDFDDLVLERGT